MVVISDLLLNLDEVGIRISEWEDGTPKKPAISATFISQMIHHGISQNSKHTWRMTFVSAVWAGMCYFISGYILGHGTDSAACAGTRSRIGQHLILKRCQKPHINGGIFTDSIRAVF
jgi:hypothetical protein